MNKKAIIRKSPDFSGLFAETTRFIVLSTLVLDIFSPKPLLSWVWGSGYLWWI